MRGFWKWTINTILGVLLAAGFLTVATFEPNIDLMARLIHVADDIRPADVIVVFSSSVVKNCEHHAHLLDREEYGARLWHEGYSKSGKIIFSGGYVDESDPAQIGALACRNKLAEKLGLPPESLIVDNAAESTHDNAVNTQKIMQMEEWHDALLVSDSSHGLRALKSLEKQGVRAYPALIPYLGYRHPHDEWFDVDRIAYLRQFLYEYVALAAYQCYGYI